MENLNNDRAVGWRPSEAGDDNSQPNVSPAATTRASDIIMAGRLMKQRQKAGEEWNDEMSEEQKEQVYLKEYKH